ncbi:MAG: Alanine--tRNA ligase [Synergistales bacterium 58_81]|nr:MAG: Alanine--tRNA ligase [Synergistales bacterium 57_84]KUK88860.1 MAG: Alanine--tRNA ligase [Synergistales bacterium 58_81]
MRWRSGKDLRELFLSYFERKDHRRFPSFSLVPDDPSILFTIAGMVPFKPYFLGMRVPSFSRATTSQKCVRTNDIENVGRTARHHTLFEMLGNFSFGDYFKSGAAAFAWEFLTDEVGLDPDRLYPTIFREDEEAFSIWNGEIGVPADRIYRMGEEDNFWSVGPVGPCGPCSELIYDQGPSFSCGRSDCGVGCDCDRYLEVWNLVFMQYNRLEDGSLEPLPKQNIDTGMGLERLSSVVQQVPGDFQTDLFKPLVEKSCEICGIRYGEDPMGDMAARVISDHFRATAFMIADGVLPSNEGRGYVLRRILRRAVRFGRLFGVDRPFLMDLFPALLEVMSDPYTELVEQRPLAEQVIEMEEDRFGRTLEQGLRLLESEIGSLSGKRGATLSGRVAFELYDTFGFPYELTEEVCQEKGVSVDREGFTGEMEKQRERARAGAKTVSGGLGKGLFEEIRERHGATAFSGYVSERIHTTVTAVVVDDRRVKKAPKGAEALMVLQDTPFYGEGGGQVGDRGTIRGESFFAEVTDTFRAAGDLVVHRVTITEGEAAEGSAVTAQVDSDRRRAIKAHHSATHLLHEALVRVLGRHVTQAGSLVNEELLRFDFTHMKPLTPEEIEKVEMIVNRQIVLNTPLEVIQTDVESARRMGAKALFNEKYGESVRVVRVPGFSAELCGGTHVDATGDIGSFKIVREEGIGSGIRRITALAGIPSFLHHRRLFEKVENLGRVLSVPPEELEKRAEEIVQENRSLLVQMDRLKSRSALSRLEQLVAGREEAGGVYVVTGAFEGTGPEALREVGDRVRQRVSPVVVVLASEEGGRGSLVAMADREAVDLGVNCGLLVRRIASELGGGGGGRPDMAQAGFRDVAGIPVSLRNVRRIVLEMTGERV